MRAFQVMVTLALALVPAGCDSSRATRQEEKETRIAAALAALSAQDRPLAEAQKFCAVETHNRLGSMGTPYKVMVKGQPVFLCCEGCEKRALGDEDRTLRSVEELKKDAAKAGP